MIKSKQELANYLTKRIEEDIIFNEEKQNGILAKMSGYNVPTGLTMDMLTGRTDLSTLSDYLLFLITKCYEDEFEKQNIVNKYFSEMEIEMYSKEHYVQETIKFPLHIKCIKVAVDQWIGVVDVNFLMTLRRAQLLNYNVNAQRTLKRVVRGENTYYKISVNVAAVKQIKQEYKNGSFIPNTITLNMPEETTEYTYDSEKNDLIIKSIDHFDISDGYHRYLAMCREKADNPDFNYPGELRIIMFSDDKIKQFIYQEDQKTKMRKIDSDSMNMNSPAILVGERLNQDVMFNLHGKLLRNGGLINLGEFASLVDYYYFKSKKYSSSVKDIIAVEKELRTKFNLLSEIYPDLLEREMDYISLAIIIQFFVGNDANAETMQKVVDALSKKDTIDKKHYASKSPRKSLVNAIAKIGG